MVLNKYLIVFFYYEFKNSLKDEVLSDISNFIISSSKYNTLSSNYYNENCFNKNKIELNN